MNGPEHFREAERLAGKQLRAKIPNGGTFKGSPTTDEILRALTHAVLGLTAASAANIRRNGAMPGLADGWAEILSEPVLVDPSDGDPLDEAMFTVWLEGNWNWVTKKMTTEAREAAVTAVLRYEARIEKDPAERLPRSSLAWWDK